MQVGDLVRVYDFSHVARKRMSAQPRWGSEQVDAHMVGLIVASDGCALKHRRVLRCVDGEWEDYNVNRLEVINASR